MLSVIQCCSTVAWTFTSASISSTASAGLASRELRRAYLCVDELPMVGLVAGCRCGNLRIMRLHVHDFTVRRWLLLRWLLIVGPVAGQLADMPALQHKGMTGPPDQSSRNSGNKCRFSRPPTRPNFVALREVCGISVVEKFCYPEK